MVFPIAVARCRYLQFQGQGMRQKLQFATLIYTRETVFCSAQRAPLLRCALSRSQYELVVHSRS